MTYHESKSPETEPEMTAVNAIFRPAWVGRTLVLHTRLPCNFATLQPCNHARDAVFAPNFSVLFGVVWCSLALFGPKKLLLFLLCLGPRFRLVTSAATVVGWVM